MSDITEGTGGAGPSYYQQQRAAFDERVAARVRAASTATGPAAPVAAPRPWAEIENNPEFASLSYGTQMTLRDQWFRQQVASSADLQGVPQRQLLRLREEFMTRAPSVVAEDLTQRGQSFIQIGEAFAADEETREQARQGMVAAFGVNLGEQSTFYRGALNLVGNVLQGLGIMSEEDLMAVGGNEGTGNLAYTPQTVADQNAFEYMLSQASQDENVRKAMQRSAVGGTVFGNVLDIGVSVLLARPFAVAAQTVARGARAGQIVGKIGHVMSKPGRAFAVEALTEAAVMTAADIAREVYNDEVLRYPSVTNTALRTAVLFGENFMLDMAFWGLLNLGGNFIRNASTVFTRRGIRGADPVASSAEEALGWVRDGLHRTDPTVIRTLPEGARPEAFRRHQEMLRRSERMTPDDVFSEDWMEVFAHSKGYDLIRQEGGGTQLRRRFTDAGKHTDQALGTYPSTTEAWTAFVEDMDRLARKSAGIDEVQGITSRTNISVTQEITAEGVRRASDVKKAEAVFQGLRVARDGSLPTANVKTSVRALQRLAKGRLDDIGDINVRRIDRRRWRRSARTGEPPALVAVDGQPTSWEMLVRRLDEGGDLSQVEDVSRRLDVLVPDGPLNADDVAEFRRAIVKFGEEAGIDTKTLKRLEELTSEVPTNAASFVGTQQGLRELGKELVDPRTGRALTSADQITNIGTVGVRQTDGSLKTYGSLEEAYLREGPSDWLTYETMQKHLREEFGYELVHDDRGFFLKKGPNYLGADKPYQTLEELLIKEPRFFPKRPVSHFTGDVEFDALGGTLRVEKGRLQGTEAEITDYFDKHFKDYDDLTTQQVLDTTDYGRLTFDTARVRYRVSLEDIGYVREFGTASEAKAFLRESHQSFEMLNDVALAAGSQIEYIGGAFRLRLPDGSYAVSRRLEGLRDGLKQLPHDTVNVPEIFSEYGIPEGYQRQIFNKYKKMMGDDIGTPRLDRHHDLEQYVQDRAMRGQGLRNKRKLGIFFRPYENMARVIADDIADNDLLRIVYKEPTEAYDVMRSKMRVIEDSVQGFAKKYSRNDLSAAMAAMSEPQRPVRDIWEQFGGKHPDDAEEIVRYFRGLLDEAGQYFGIDSYKLLSDYLPRFQTEINKNMQGAFKNLNEPMSEVFRRMPEYSNWKQVPELRFFAENMRVRDVVDMTADTYRKGADHMVITYFRKGLRKKYMTEAYQKAQSYVGDLMKNGTLDKDFGGFLVSYVDELAGMAENTGRRMITEGLDSAINDFIQRVKPGADRAVVEAMTQNMRALTIGAHMAARPFLPIRNMQQIWTTLAVRLGNDVVYEASRMLKKNPSIYRELVEQNVIISGKAPILDMIAAGDMTGLQRWIDSGMVFFKNSDDHNRAITALASWIPYDEAVNKLQKGIIPPEDFISAARLDRLEPDIVRDVVRLTESGNYRAAKRQLAREWVNQTQFPYLQPGNPRMFKGTVGKWFGHYGHFPTMFRENVVRAFGPTVPRKVKFQTFGRYVANTAGLYFVFEKALGINARNFNPLGSLWFSGGPYYSMMNTVLDAGGQGYEARIARANLPEEIVRTFVPGSAFGFAWGQAGELWDAGHRWEALLRALSFPVIDPRNPNAR